MTGSPLCHIQLCYLVSHQNRNFIVRYPLLNLYETVFQTLTLHLYVFL